MSEFYHKFLKNYHLFKNFRGHTKNNELLNFESKFVDFVHAKSHSFSSFIKTKNPQKCTQRILYLNT